MPKEQQRQHRRVRGCYCQEKELPFLPVLPFSQSISLTLKLSVNYTNTLAPSPFPIAFFLLLASKPGTQAVQKQNAQNWLGRVSRRLWGEKRTGKWKRASARKRAKEGEMLCGSKRNNCKNHPAREHIIEGVLSTTTTEQQALVVLVVVNIKGST